MRGRRYDTHHPHTGIFYVNDAYVISNIILISVHAQWKYIQLQYFGCLFQRKIERHNALAHWNIPWRMRKGRRNTYTFRRPPTSSLGWSSEEHKQIDMNSSSHFFAFTPLSMDKLSVKLHFLAVSLKPVLWSVINWRLSLVLIMPWCRASGKLLSSPRITQISDAYVCMYSSGGEELSGLWLYV